MKRVSKIILKAILLTIIVEILVSLTYDIFDPYNRSFYTVWSGIMVFTPISAFLFSLWYIIFPNKKKISYAIPFLIEMACVYLSIAGSRHIAWRLSIITLDGYMAGGFLAPVVCAIVQWSGLCLKRWLSLKKQKNNA